MMPEVASSTWVAKYSIGVATTPRSMTSMPTDCRPAARAAASSGPDRRPSRPMTATVSPLLRMAAPKAWPMRCATEASSVLPMMPRMSYALKIVGERGIMIMSSGLNGIARRPRSLLALAQDHPARRPEAHDARIQPDVADHEERAENHQHPAMPPEQRGGNDRHQRQQPQIGRSQCVASRECQRIAADRPQYQTPEDQAVQVDAVRHAG